MSETSNRGMLLLSAEESKKNTFEGNKWMFLDTLDEKAWQDFLSDFNQRVGRETKLKKLQGRTVEYGDELLGNCPDRHRTRRESEKGAA